VFNHFDKILQLPGRFASKRKDSNLSPKQINQICKVLSENIVNSSINLRKAKNGFDEIWLEICKEMI